MGAIHIAGYGLVIGALGQLTIYETLFPRFPMWGLLSALLPPWLVAYTISFCNRPPFGPRPFRHCLLCAMGWYAVATVLAETLGLLLRPEPRGHISPVVGRILMYFGWLSFIPLIRACVCLR